MMSTWRTKISICVSLVLFALLAPAGLFAQEPLVPDDLVLDAFEPSFRSYGWQIDSFDAVIELREDGSLFVTETIDTQFNPIFSKHGIFRDIPVVYRDLLGNRVKIDLDVESVKQNGEPANYVTSREGSDKRIKIGSGTIEISGPITYEIAYTVDRALLYFDEFDEIYWNVTGDEWEVPINKVSAVVVLPEGVEPISSACYTGRLGSTNTDCGIAEEDNFAGFASSDFLTVAVSFEKGIVPEPTLGDEVLFFLTDNWPSLIPLFYMFGIFALWFFLGRDPKMKTIVAEFEPPENIRAAYAGLITQNNVTSQQTAAMVIQLAVEGYLTIDVQQTGKGLTKKRKTTFIKKKNVDDGLDEVHALMMKAIFSGGKKQVSLASLRRSTPTSKIRNIRKKMMEEMKVRGWYTKHSFAWRSTLMVVAAIIFYGIFAFGSFFGVFTAVMIGVSAIVTGVFGFLMPKRTLVGTEVARKVLGFKLFMNTAERYRSQWHEEENMFTDYLPYAISFGIVKKWARQLGDMSFHQPSWYTSNIAYLSATDFANDLSATTISLRSAVAPSSRSSSGSSGGGFSGGGFGGGGGGSW